MPQARTEGHGQLVPGRQARDTISPNAGRIAWMILACTLCWGLGMYALWLIYDFEHSAAVWVPQTLFVVGLATGNTIALVIAHSHHVYAKDASPYSSILPPLAATNAILLALILASALAHPAFVQMIPW